MSLVAVFGHRGQDGSYLTEQCLAKGHEVLGVDRGVTEWIRASGTSPLASLDIHDAHAVDSWVATHKPDYAFYLVAHHHASDQGREDLADLFAKSFNTHVLAWVHLLEALRTHAPACHTVYAGSSRVFGSAPEGALQDEHTRFEPRCAYGITKVAGIEAGRMMREQHGMFVSHAFLYNHESERRTPAFLSKRLCIAAARAKRGVTKGEAPHDRRVETVGDLSALVDWGYAPDTTDAMWRMATAEQARDFVVATGIPHTVQDFAQTAFDAVGLDWRDYVKEDTSRTFTRQPRRVGSARALTESTGWKPSVTFAEMIARMVERVSDAELTG
jgi:GDPmannose 4,6-dehydratase